MNEKTDSVAKKPAVAEKYSPQEIEPKWQAEWAKEKLYQTDLENAKKPFFNLMMFPYPSAEGLHVGSFFTYGGIDAYGRFKRMQGYDVFEPIGLDGFGIHSENYAFKVGRTPQEHAKISEENFYRQLHSLGNAFDWSRTVETYDPDYYRWTQWLFVELFKAGLAYKASAKVNFCPSCKTVLADEQVIDGKCERCGSVVEKKDLSQWFFKITQYTKRLLGGLDTIDWSEKVKTAQRNWIGESEGARITFPVVDTESSIEVFTTRPDTLAGATFLVISPDHPFVNTFITSASEAVKAYVKTAQSHIDTPTPGEEKEKSGVFSGAYALNPFNNEHLPIWIADYVLIGYGTGAIMAVPAHDERDFAFAKKYELPIRQVIQSETASHAESEKVYTGAGIVINSASWDGLRMPEDMEKILTYIEEKGIGKREKTYHLRDWLISRQRYWAAPIPMIFCEQCERVGKSWFDTDEAGAQKGLHTPQHMAGWYPEENLPVLLPEVSDYKPVGTGKAPLANYPEFYETTCPRCRGKAIRETDVIDTFLDSAWYFYRYTSTDFSDKPFDKDRLEKWLPVASYIGGAEHSVLHLLYARFINMVLHDLGYVSFEEPFHRFRHNGLIIKDGAKMSKSKGNIINPDEYVKKFGADTLRTYLAFIGPFSEGGDFRDTGIEGMHRFLKRVWHLMVTSNITSGSVSTDVLMHTTIKGVTEDIEALRFNTALAKLMTWYNELSDAEEITKEQIEVFIKLLSPFAPHLGEEVWHRLGHTDSIHTASWPEYDEAYLRKDTVTIAVQVNGKLRHIVTVPSHEAEDKAHMEAMIRKEEKVKKALANTTIKQVIYVQGKVINFVVS